MSSHFSDRSRLGTTIVPSPSIRPVIYELKKRGVIGRILEIVSSGAQSWRFHIKFKVSYAYLLIVSIPLSPLP